MAILEGLLLDNLLENIVRSEVYIALRTDLDDSTTRFGTGTAEDPYDASKVDLGGGSFFYKLDAILADSTKVPENTTVYLGPGIFETKGDRAWAPRSGWRIIGGGWAGSAGTATFGPTLLKLVEHASGENFVFGINIDTTWLEGFEVAYLGIDCNLPAVNARKA